MELVVVMILTGIAVTLVYRTYIYINQTYSRYVDSRERLIAFGEFQMQFQKDLDGAEQATADHNMVSIVFDQKLISYYFIDSAVAREQGNRLDTFQIGLERYHFYYHENHAELLTSIEMTMSYKNEEVTVNFEKDYDVQSLFLNLEE